MKPPARADAENDVAPIVRANALISIRAYDAAGQCLYDLGQVCAGEDVDPLLLRALRDLRTAFVNIHRASRLPCKTRAGASFTSGR
jgi:hypothetical protein